MPLTEYDVDTMATRCDVKAIDGCSGTGYLSVTLRLDTDDMLELVEELQRLLRIKR